MLMLIVKSMNKIMGLWLLFSDNNFMLHVITSFISLFCVLCTSHGLCYDDDDDDDNNGDVMSVHYRQNCNSHGCILYTVSCYSYSIFHVHNPYDIIF